MGSGPADAITVNAAQVIRAGTAAFTYSNVQTIDLGTGTFTVPVDLSVRQRGSPCRHHHRQLHHHVAPGLFLRLHAGAYRAAMTASTRSICYVPVALSIAAAGYLNLEGNDLPVRNDVNFNFTGAIVSGSLENPRGSPTPPTA